MNDTFPSYADIGVHTPPRMKRTIPGDVIEIATEHERAYQDDLTLARRIRSETMYRAQRTRERLRRLQVQRNPRHGARRRAMAAVLAEEVAVFMKAEEHLSRLDPTHNPKKFRPKRRRDIHYK
jgi:hypothetical protein